MSKKVYSIDRNNFFRIHHIRPRFKNNVERVLLFVASEIADLPPSNKKEFDKKLNAAIRRFPGNKIVADKTINNWRTEISSLFGFVLTDLTAKQESPSPIAKKLAGHQDLVEFFKFFCYTFQYPGGHLKSHEVKAIIDKGIKFSPVRTILELFMEAEKKGRSSFGLNKAEATHCIFNDLRVTTGKLKVNEILRNIVKNKKEKVLYDWRGDIVRYAGDVLDYMYHANLLKKYGQNYHINKSEKETILFFLQNTEWYDGYDEFYGKSFKTNELREAQNNWFYYLAEQSAKLEFETDVLAYLGLDKRKYDKLEKLSDALKLEDFRGAISEPEDIVTKQIGDTGESLVHGHECMRLKLGNREELIPRVVCIPNHLKLGYDIRSFELDKNIRCIEVKTTISNSDIDFKKFHLTDNEWNVAQSMKEKYYVYRLVITRTTVRLFIIRNPIEQYKRGLLKMEISKGVDVSFSEKSGQYEELLQWED